VSDILDNAIKDNATGPRRASGDSRLVEQHGPADQIQEQALRQPSVATGWQLGTSVQA
jgi:hypothetical protein